MDMNMASIWMRSEWARTIGRAAETVTGQLFGLEEGPDEWDD